MSVSMKFHDVLQKKRLSGDPELGRRPFLSFEDLRSTSSASSTRQERKKSKHQEAFFNRKLCEICWGSYYNNQGGYSNCLYCTNGNCFEMKK